MTSNQRQPIPAFAALRAESPPYYNEQYDFYATAAGFADVDKRARGPQAFSSGTRRDPRIIRRNIEIPLWTH